MVATDKRFAALSLTLKHDGIKLLCMIRLCPLPYSISNGAISTFPTVRPWAFMAATALSTPKLMIHIFIGTRLRMLAEEGRKMDAKTRAINYGSVVGGLILGVATGWIIYKRYVSFLAPIKHMNAKPLSIELLPEQSNWNTKKEQISGALVHLLHPAVHPTTLCEHLLIQMLIVMRKKRKLPVYAIHVLHTSPH